MYPGILHVFFVFKNSVGDCRCEKQPTKTWTWQLFFLTNKQWRIWKVENSRVFRILQLQSLESSSSSDEFFKASFTIPQGVWTPPQQQWRRKVCSWDPPTKHVIFSCWWLFWGRGFASPKKCQQLAFFQHGMQLFRLIPQNCFYYYW